MRKVLTTLLFIILILPIRIKAQTIWKEVKESGYLSSEERYLWYKEEITNVDYLLKELGTQEFVDKNDCFFTDYTDYIDEEPIQYEDREIKQEWRKVDIDKNNTTHFTLNSFYLDGTLNIYEIEIYNKDILIDYKIKDYNNIDFNIIYDKDTLNNFINIPQNFNITIIFEEEYNYEDLKVKIYYTAKSNNHSTFETTFSNRDMKYTLAKYTQMLGVEVQNCDNVCTLELSTNDYWQRTIDTFACFYSFQDKLCKKYDIKNIYADGYYKELDNYIKDESSKKIFYSYENTKASDNNNKKTTTSKNKSNIKLIPNNKENISYEKLDINNNNKTVENNDNLLSQNITSKNIKNNKNSTLVTYIIIVFILLALCFFILIVIKKLKEKKQSRISV